jgi:GNAT superfamily N-acetyltransferase
MKRERAGLTIERRTTTSIDPDRLARGFDAIFFEASNTQSFASAEERARFRHRWLGRYLDDFPEWAFLARDAEGEVAGYLVGCIDDPGQDARFEDVGYFALLAAETARYPAHLHVNVRADLRGSGLGARLVAAFLTEARRAGVRGVHVVTSEGARNVGFYLANGFSQVRAFRVGEKRLVMLGMELAPAA